MSLSENLVEQEKYLSENLGNINLVVSALIGCTVKLQVVNRTISKDKYILILEDTGSGCEGGFKSQCGIMKNAFKNVTISTSNIWWKENGCIFALDFKYELADYGRNGMTICRISCIDNFIKILN